MNKENTKKGAALILLDYVEMFVFTIVIVILMLSFFFRLCVVSGPSMNNTLLDGEKLIVSDLFYTPKTGDIIVFHQTSDLYDTFNEPIVKRVIATGGEFVKIDYKQNKVFVSADKEFTEDELLDESTYAHFEKPDGIWKESLHTDEKVFEVPEGHLFVMGDNRNVSADSRGVQVGLVDERRVLGKVLFRITPFDKFGKVG
jgi:signal peptidase I